MDITTYKTKLSAAFRAMRKEGLVARQNFSCCGSCANYELATIIDELPAEKKATTKGYVFYHNQDADHMRRPNFDGLYLGYSSSDGNNCSDIAQIVVACIQRAGLTAEWNGEITTRIFAKMG
jgi:hypothetical protein